MEAPGAASGRRARPVRRVGGPARRPGRAWRAGLREREGPASRRQEGNENAALETVSLEVRDSEKRRVTRGGVRRRKRGPVWARSRARRGRSRAARAWRVHRKRTPCSRTRLARLRTTRARDAQRSRSAPRRFVEPQAASADRSPPKSLGRDTSWPSKLSAGTAPPRVSDPWTHRRARDRTRGHRRARARVCPSPYPAFAAHPRGRGAKAKTKRRRALRSRPCAYLERVMEAAIARGASIVRVTRVPGVVTAHGEVTARWRRRAARTNLPVHTPRSERANKRLPVDKSPRNSCQHQSPIEGGTHRTSVFVS